MDFTANDQLLADKVKLVINQKGEVILISTSLTVLRVEIDEEYSVESMELSQKQLRQDAVADQMTSVAGFMGNHKANRYLGYRGSEQDKFNQEPDLQN